MTELFYILAAVVLFAGNVYSLRDLQIATGTDLYFLQTMGLEQNEKNMATTGLIMLVLTAVVSLVLLLPAFLNGNKIRGRSGRLMCILAAFLTDLPMATILHVMRMDFPGGAAMMDPDQWKAYFMPLLSIGLPLGVLIFALLSNEHRTKQTRSLVLMGIGIATSFAALFIPYVGDLVMFCGICLYAWGLFSLSEQAYAGFEKRPVLLHVMYIALGLAGILHFITRLQVY
ncbi:MAG: hypothetical protein IJ589_00225 [Lachnospiraceae bacterium]|nr:hypothetical protein [Lachnospiraceae bacterium]